MQKDLYQTLKSLTNAARLSLHLGQLVQSAKLLGFVERMVISYPSRNNFHKPDNFESCKEEIKEFLAEVNFQAAWNEGQAMTLEQAVDLALEQVV
jgi:predicted transcriptional regulator